MNKWKTIQLTDASPTANVAFPGRGSVMVSGTYGGGTVLIHPIAEDTENGLQVVGSASYEIDGTTIKDASVPSGHYQLELNGSTGGDVTIYYNTQIELNRIS